MKNNREKKILIIGPLPPPAHGEALAIADVANSLENKILLNTNHSQLNYFKGFRLFNALQDIFLMLKFFGLLWRIDVVYISLKRSFWGGLKDIYFINIAKFFNKRVVAHVHGGSFEEYYTALAKRHRLRVKKAINKINKIIVLSDFSKRQFLKICPAEKIIVINNYIRKIDYRRKKINKNDSLKILYLSHVVEEKGIFSFLSLADAAFKNKKNWEFDIYGYFSVADKNKFKKMIAALPNTAYLKELTKNKTAVLQKYDILIFPSRLKEGQPLVILEAMSSGVTVLANSIGGVPDIIKNGVTGFLVKNNNISEYLRRIKKIDSDRSLLKKIGGAAGKEVENNYSLNNLNKIMEVLYED